ncbi:MAG: lysylphosphatidylglycerol synthase domain-containing protein, partial [Clostridia bacterium]|nr:lysylphosphatidylglycerol synthase domain-containing protein [Clostridia bacterium]
LVAFGFSAETSVRLSLAVFAATNIINFIPASPGAIGLFEYGAILGLGGLGIPQSTALAAGLLLHMIQYMALLPLGAVLYIAAAHGKLREAVGEKWHGKHHKGTKQ